MKPELQVIRDFFDLSVYLIGRVEKFPRQHRYSLGTELERRLLAVQAQLIRAKYASDKAAKRTTLAEVNVELEVIRFQVRLALALKALPTNSAGHAAARLFAVGQQVGGWLRAMA